MKRVVITGANRGYGLALVDACLARGDRVWAVCRDPDAATNLQQRQDPERCRILTCDLADDAAIDALGQDIGKDTDAIDILINNAGMMGGDDLASLDSNTLAQMFRINAIAPLLLSRACVDLLAAGDQPCILISSSSWGSIWYKSDPTNKANDRVFGYSSSKAAVNMFARGLAAALHEQGITVLTHHPGGAGDPGGGPSREESALASLQLIADHGLADSGKFYHWRGHEFPW